MYILRYDVMPYFFLIIGNSLENDVHLQEALRSSIWLDQTKSSLL